MDSIICLKRDQDKAWPHKPLLGNQRERILVFSSSSLAETTKILSSEGTGEVLVAGGGEGMCD